MYYFHLKCVQRVSPDETHPVSEVAYKVYDMSLAERSLCGQLLLRVDGLVLLLVAENILWMQTLKLNILEVVFEPTYLLTCVLLVS